MSPHKNKKVFLKNINLGIKPWMVFVLVLACFLLQNKNTNDVMAYTTSIKSTGEINIDLGALGADGSAGANIGIDDVTVVSTCPLGYTLGISGPNDSTLYKNGDSSNTGVNQKIMASAGTPAEALPIVGDDGEGHSYYGTWGYAVGADKTIQSNFIGLTSTPTIVVTKESASGNGADVNEDAIRINYGVSASSLLEPGVYKMAESRTGDNVITYYLTANPNCGSYYLRYNDNGANSSTTMTGMTKVVAENDELVLSPSNYQRSGYGFAGWSLVQLDPDDSDFKTDLMAALGTQAVFGPMENITIDQTVINYSVIENGASYITLYAIWVPSEGDLQDWNGCSSMSINEVTALTDKRDHQTYAVAKLADETCWMIENLRLEGENTRGQNSFDSSVTNESLAQGYYSNATFGTFVGLANPETNFNTTNANSVYKSDGSGSHYDPVRGGLEDIGTSDYPSYRMPRYRNDNHSLTVSDMIGASDDGDYMANIYSYGNYYTWAAAMANVSFYGETTSSTTLVDGKTSDEAGSSICPTGWRLPYGGNTGNGLISGGFANLDIKLGGTGDIQQSAEASNRWRKYPNNFIMSGDINNNNSAVISERGIMGMYWSSTAKNIYSASVFGFNDSTIGPGVGYYNFGITVRCVIVDPNAANVLNTTLNNNSIDLDDQMLDSVNSDLDASTNVDTENAVDGAENTSTTDNTNTTDQP